ncbi:MAG: ABC transporter ATP-binding protein [Nocardioidaceae bacterium]
MSTAPLSTAAAVLGWCLRQARRTLAASMLSALVRQLAFLAIPWCLGRAVQALAEADSSMMYGALGLLAICVLVNFAGLCGWMWWAHLAEARLANDLRCRLLEVTLRQDTARLETIGSNQGDLLSRAIDDVDAVLTWIHGLAHWVVISVTVIVLVPAIGAVDPVLLVVALGCGSLLAVTNVIAPRLFGPRIAAVAAEQGARAESVQQLVAAAPSLRGVGAEQALVRRHAARSAAVRERMVAAARVGAGWQAIGTGLPGVAVGVGLLIGGLAVLDGRVDIGELTTFALWMGTVQLAAAAIVARLGERSAALASAQRIADVLGLDPVGSTMPAVVGSGGHPDGNACRTPPEARVGGSESRVSLRLQALVPDLPAAEVMPVDLEVAPGQWALVTGPTGSGKSTLLRSIAGATAAEGRVLVGSRDVAASDPDDRAELLTLVPQGPTLFHGTIRDNLRMAAPHAGDDELLAACHTAGFDTVVAQLAEGLDTLVGERGATLSGGQRQRLALARALLRPVPVLLLDDVTSGLDVETEQVTLARLRRATADRIVVWAGHRPALRGCVDLTVELSACPDGCGDG